MKTLSVRHSGLSVALLLILAATLAQADASGASRKAFRYSVVPSDSHYLFPGGEVNVSWNLLSLPEDRVMALTFDDGPVERDLEISALLKSHDILATFFYIGNKVKYLPGVVREVMAAKHEIGFHSYTHRKQSAISQASLEEEFRLGAAAMENLKVSTAWYRPPYGLFNSRIIKIAKKYGMETVLWTIDPRDWSGISAETVAKRVIAMFHPGAVLLFHSSHAATLQALPEILRAAENKKYRFVSLTEWRRTIKNARCRTQKHLCQPEVLTASASPGKAVTPVAAVPVIPEGKPAPPVVTDGGLSATPAVTDEAPTIPMVGYEIPAAPAIIDEAPVIHTVNDGVLVTYTVTDEAPVTHLVTDEAPVAHPVTSRVPVVAPKVARKIPAASMATSEEPANPIIVGAVPGTPTVADEASAVPAATASKKVPTAAGANEGPTILNAVTIIPSADSSLPFPIP